MLRQAPSLRFLAPLLALTFVATACGGGSQEAAPTPDPSPTTVEENSSDEIEPPQPTAAALSSPEVLPATFEVRPSLNQLHVLGTAPGTALELVAADGTIAPGTSDDQGSFLWRDIAEGDYVVRALGDEIEESEPATVFGEDAVPDPEFYAEQTLDEGFGYIATRDGTTLSATVWFPSGEPPYPTVVEYSGYSPSNPSSSGFPQLFTTMGYAYVGVNMRGTGCSGGSFEFFEPVQLTDGYDMIEAVAAQDWVLHNQVGMVGVSYPGISQLYVAQTQPPNLAAITPLSVLDDAAQSTLYAGGLLNTGFALAWSDEREADAEPYGQGWEQGMVDGGDTTCADNQLLRLQNTDARSLIFDNPYYVEEIAAPLAPINFVDRITVPVFLAGAWQDEQTGGHFPAMIDRFTGTDELFVNLVNGSHTESLASMEIFQRYAEFLDLYVARRTPNLGGAALAAPILSSSLTGASGVSMPDPGRLSSLSYEEALAVFESEDSIRILFEEGAADDAPPGAPVPRYVATYDEWPLPGTETRAWYLQGDGSMRPEPSEAASSISTYVSDPDSVPDVFYEGGSSGIWAADVVLDWLPIPDGTGAAWITDPLDEDTVVIGFGSLDLWLQSSADDTDLEVTISEVRPDGAEVYVQTGWLRASHRALDMERSTETFPVPTNLEADAAPLPAGEFSEVRVQIFPFAHAFRAGSQIRVTVDAPGGARPIWAFDSTVSGGETNQIAHDATHPSRLVLNVMPGIDVPPEPPACGALRSQPCRDYVPFTSN